MPTQIIDNFDLNTSKPLDNRLVVGPNAFYTTKDSITYKYEGMRVWDLNDGVPYVWSGTTFSSENSIAVTGNGTQDYIAKFGSATNVILNSQIIDTGVSVGINGNPDSQYRLDVKGKIRTYTSGATIGGFVGDGSQVTNLNASNISSGTMGIQYLQGGVMNYILTADTASSATYKDPTSITVGKANQLSTVRSLWGQNFDGTGNITGDINLGGSITNITGSIQFKNINNGILTVSYSGTSNIPRNYSIPGLNSNGTFALLERNQTFTAAQTISGSSGTMLTVNRSSSGNNYTFFSTTGANNVGIFFQNSGSARSLYMDGSGNLITGGNAPNANGFNNFRLSSGGLSIGPLAYPGTTIRKMIVGTIDVNYTNNSVSDHTIVYGSGFTLEYHSHASTGSYGAVYVKITGDIGGNPVVVASIAETGVIGMNPPSVLTLIELPNNRFLVQTGGVGSTSESAIRVSFSYFEI